MGEAGSRALLVLASIAVCAAITAAAFWAVDLVVGDMPSPWWGAVGGALLGVLSYFRTGRVDRRTGGGA